MVSFLAKKLTSGGDKPTTSRDWPVVRQITLTTSRRVIEQAINSGSIEGPRGGQLTITAPSGTISRIAVSGIASCYYNDRFLGTERSSVKFSKLVQIGAVYTLPLPKMRSTRPICSWAASIYTEANKVGKHRLVFTFRAKTPWDFELERCWIVQSAASRSQFCE